MLRDNEVRIFLLFLRRHDMRPLGAWLVAGLKGAVILTFFFN